jgi:D-3-phosphoglycerate dehydrogenase
LATYKVVTQKRSDIPSHEYEMEYLAPIGAEIIAVSATSEGEFIEAAKDADAIIASGRRITEAIIDSLENCKIIALGSVGADSVDVDAATRRNIPVTNTPDIFIEEVADHTMMLMLAAFRRLTILDKLVRENRWSEGRPVLADIPRLLGQTLGFVSFGHVARATALRAKAFGVRMLAYDPYIEEVLITEYGVEPVGLTELLQRSDIVSMHAPSTQEVHHMLREEHFRLMKPTALFINTGRGPTVDESALIEALQQGWIAGAGLDVLEKEPPGPENPLLTMENVIFTPHVASASARMRPESRRRVGQEIALVLGGRWPRTCVNPSVLEKTTLTRWQPYSMGRGPVS